GEEGNANDLLNVEAQELGVRFFGGWLGDERGFRGGRAVLKWFHQSSQGTGFLGGAPRETPRPPTSDQDVRRMSRPTSKWRTVGLVSASSSRSRPAAKAVAA